MIVMQKRLEEVLAAHLYEGNHEEAEKRMCVMEAAAYIAGEPWSDAPQCVCPTIRQFMMSWNDSLPTDKDRDRLLKPLLPQVIDTRGSDALKERRSYMALDWLVRVHTPKFLNLTDKLKPHAKTLRELDEIVDLAGATAAGDNVAAAGAAAWAAAGDAARDAAGAAARDAAGAAARAALQPTVKWLQESASDLVVRMCELKDY